MLLCFFVLLHKALIPSEIFLMSLYYIVMADDLVVENLDSRVYRFIDYSKLVGVAQGARFGMFLPLS